MSIREYLKKEIKYAENEIRNLQDRKQDILIHMIKEKNFNKTQLEFIKHNIRTKEYRIRELEKKLQKAIDDGTADQH